MGEINSNAPISVEIYLTGFVVSVYVRHLVVVLTTPARGRTSISFGVFDSFSPVRVSVKTKRYGENRGNARFPRTVYPVLPANLFGPMLICSAFVDY